MYVSRTIVEIICAPKTRAIAFFVACVAAAAGLYVAGSPQQKIQSGAIAAEGPPVVRADPLQPTSARVAAIDAAATMKPVMAPDAPRDKATLIRQLQTTLASAGCYDGAISGIWTDASRDAMQRFVVSVNAQLPVAEPDATLLALVASNAEASCSAAPLTTGALSPAPSKAQAAPVRVAEDHPAPARISLTDSAEAAEVRTSMLDFSWAPSGMLGGAQSNSPGSNRNDASSSAVESLIIGSSEPDSTDASAPSKPTEQAKQAVISPIADPAPRKVTLQVESDETATDTKRTKTAAIEDSSGDKASAADTDDDDAAASAPKSRSQKSKASKAAKKKESAKKRSSPAGAKQDGQKSMSSGFDSLAKSVSSLFD